MEYWSWWYIGYRGNNSELTFSSTILTFVLLHKTLVWPAISHFNLIRFSAQNMETTISKCSPSCKRDIIYHEIKLPLACFIFRRCVWGGADWHRWGTAWSDQGWTRARNDLDQWKPLPTYTKTLTIDHIPLLWKTMTVGDTSHIPWSRSRHVIAMPNPLSGI